MSLAGCLDFFSLSRHPHSIAGIFASSRTGRSCTAPARPPSAKWQRACRRLVGEAPRRRPHPAGALHWERQAPKRAIPMYSWAATTSAATATSSASSRTPTANPPKCAASCKYARRTPERTTGKLAKQTDYGVVGLGLGDTVWRAMCNQLHPLSSIVFYASNF